MKEKRFLSLLRRVGYYASIPVLIGMGCKEQKTQQSPGQQSDLSATSWKVTDLREFGRPSLYIATDTPKGVHDQASLSINCSKGEPATLKVQTDKQYNKPHVSVRLRFDGDAVLTQTWKAEHTNMFAPDSRALIRQVSEHNYLVFIQGSTTHSFDIRGLNETSKPFSAFCGLGGASKALNVSTLPVHGKYVARLMTSDEVFAILHTSDEIGKPQARSDPAIPDSLIVDRSYRTEDQTFTIELRRLRRDGPYMLTKISIPS